MTDAGFAELRNSLDSRDTFISGGYGVMKTAGATGHAARMKKIPVWSLDDERIKQLIVYRFPKAKTDLEQRRLAARMIRIIHLYYRVGATRGTIAEELHMTDNAVKCLLSRVNREMAGPLKPHGRPRKPDPIDTTNGGEPMYSSEGRYGH